MPKLVCSNCEQELRIHLTGVRVIEFSGNGPYKLWCADEWECPTCKIRIIGGFGQRAIEHYEEGFNALLAQVPPTKLRRDFEDQHQRMEFLPSETHRRQQ